MKKPQFGLEFTLSGLLLITGCSVITLSIFKPWHILMVLPFAILLMVVAVEQVIRRNKYIGFGLLGILLFSNLFAVAGDYRGLVEKRGSLGFSPAIYDLTRYLQDQRIQSVTTGDWGLARLIYYLSNGQVKTRECFVYGPHPPMPRWYYTRIDETLKQDSVWVFYVPNKGDTESQTAFTEYLAKQSVDPKVETISDSYGPLFNIYRIPKK